MKGDKQNKLLNYNLYKVIFMNNKKKNLVLRFFLSLY